MTVTLSEVAALESTKVAKAKEALNGKIYELSIVKGYVSHWGMPEAVRELIQNSLDSDSPFVYEFFSEGFDSWGLRLRSEFSTLTPQSLLLGATSKAGSTDSIGSFGEGYKIALLVLCREGFNITIENGPMLWEPFFRHSKTFDDEVLAIAERLAEGKTNKGLTFTIKGLSPEEVALIRESCLKMQDEVGEVLETEVGDILLDKPGKLYVGSLYICDTDLHYGYNFKPQFVRLERDRRTMHSWDLKGLTLRAWYDTKDMKRVAKMISEEVPDVEYAEYDSPELVKEECYRIFRERNPNSFVARTPHEAEQMVKEGLVDTKYVGGAFSSAIYYSPSYQTEPKIKANTSEPFETLAQFKAKWFSKKVTPATREFDALIDYAKRNWVRR